MSFLPLTVYSPLLETTAPVEFFVVRVFMVEALVVVFELVFDVLLPLPFVIPRVLPRSTYVTFVFGLAALAC